MGSLKSFGTRMTRVAVNFDKNLNKTIKRTAIIIDQAVVLATPVDTGRARSNWIVSVGAPMRSAIEPFSPGFKLGLSETGNANSAMAQGRQAIAGRKPGKTIYIVNNLGYIDDLNKGTSQQAAAGFQEKAVQAGVAFLRKARVLK